jgi:hypothetical protein
LNKARAPLYRAADLGLTRGAISARVKRGTLFRIHRGICSPVPREALTREALWLAALLALGEGSALFGRSSAVHWRAWRWPPPLVEVVVPRYRRPLTGVSVHECRNLDPRDVTTHLGLPVTTVARTAVDLTDVLLAEEITNFLHEAAFRRRLSLSAVRDAMARANGRRRLARLDEAIALWQLGSAGIKSRLERDFLALVVEAGLPKPIPNIHVDGIEVDAYWPDSRLVVEIDGPNHTRPPTLRGGGATRSSRR